jgi:DNA helicase-2/ATP-dependent DNA helicase PcrA
LSYAKMRYRFGKSQTCEPSPFLDEVGYEHVEQTGGLSQTNQRSSVTFSKTSPSRFRKSTELSPSDIPDFKVVPAAMIKENMTVLHKRFGRGQVTKIEGGESKVATIIFDSAGEKRIMLKFAKLGIEK